MKFTFDKSKLSLVLTAFLVIIPCFLQAEEQSTTAAKLEQMRLEKLGSYAVNSHYKHEDGRPKYTNRLIFEDAPYLLQHAHNPINWYTWSDEAFAAAKLENKPIFVSIGYATCHWCHVMEAETFDNEVVANYLNEHFISIKVDREQRPDIDAVYMTASSLITGQTGWPLTGFLRPDAKPFFMASYLSTNDFLDISKQVRNKWQNSQSDLNQMAEEIYQSIIIENEIEHSTKAVTKASKETVFNRMLSYEDKFHGGIDEAPKFPIEPKLLLMLTELQGIDNFEQSPLWQFVEATLDGMLQGGIYDQIGGGFHRYSTDKAWRIPHFEKTLYNQAQLIENYSLAWQLSGNEEYRRVSLQTLDFVISNMQSDDGCFYSAMDADSDGNEGSYYLWDHQQIDALFNKQDADLIKDLYNITLKGNFKGSNTLYMPFSLFEFAQSRKISYQQLLSKLKPLQQKMLLSRGERVQPSIDYKQVTQWNAMMVSSLANAGYIYAKPKYTDIAVQCAERIWQKARNKDSKLYRNIIQGRASITANLADYGEYIQALLVLYDISANPQWLHRAQQLYQVSNSLFEDQKNGGFYNSVEDDKGVNLFRTKASNDNDMPSPNASMLAALVMLNQRLDDLTIKRRIDRSIHFFSGALNNKTLSLTSMLTAIEHFRNAKPASIVYAAKGKVKVESTYSKKRRQLMMTLSIADGWHLNSHQPLQEYLKATRVSSSKYKLSMQYEQGHIKSLGFNKEKLSLYENKVLLLGLLEEDLDTAFLVFNIDLQACNDKVCLPPESLLISPMIKY